jgi:prepilin-type N-terminal cleavage/methylation domain-containing protein
MKKCNNKSVEGFSLVELMVVLIIISIMAGITGYYLINHQKAYKADDQALKIIDIFQEARQRSLTQRETMRVEIDLTDKVVRLIQENKPDPTGDADDEKIRETTLLDPLEVNIEQRPSEITVNPPETLPAPTAVFKPSVYPKSSTHRICTIRFRSDGQVVDVDNTASGGSGTPTGVTLFIWSPNKTDATKSDIARAITIIGTTGSIRMWEYNRNSTNANKWSDTRRVGS